MLSTHESNYIVNTHLDLIMKCMILLIKIVKIKKIFILINVDICIEHNERDEFFQIVN